MPSFGLLHRCVCDFDAPLIRCWLLKFILKYHILIQLIAFTIIAPYISTDKWKPVFEEQVRPVNTVWYDVVWLSISYAVDVFLRFSVYQVVSAYTNTGASLVDTSMVPFQTAYVLIFIVSWLILAGNTSFVGVSP